MSTIRGALPTAQVVERDKFRATWLLVATQYGIPVNAPSVARKIQEALPLMGFVPVSNMSAVLGDKVVVFDVRTSSAFPGHTVAEAAERLDNLPLLAGGWAADLQTLDVLALGSTATQAASDVTGSASEQAAALDAARAAGNTEANASSWLTKLSDALKSAGLVVVIAGAVVLFVVLKGKSKDWE